ncbi:Hsp20/alpha crystallin family protein [Heyndrickxia oleronia]|uniref:Hsp20/alpha crystallin family protein n=1 Tax=Heyndrickxia oleronia TaxID=38875 RepID=A0AAW6SQW2_9BACI|nr:Hsp20/alpha crystallin family protein [Heyndrickxia oleronia]MDH5160653.1 Hsp20/alpha crystallin family protein [Heyndrickxia oleronia]
MDIDKLKQWMDISQKYQNGNFWDMIFEQISKDPSQNEANSKPPTPNVRSTSTYPLVDIYLTDTQIIVIIELPGYKREDVSLSLAGNILVVKGTSQLPLLNPIVIQNERKYGAFERKIELPEPTKASELYAKFESGLLIVTYMRKYSSEEQIPIS